MLIQSTFERECRGKAEDARMLPGDVIAFAGHCAVSRAIARFTRNPVSHVGVYFGDGLLAESTSLGAADGVSIVPLAKRVAEYDGAVYWLPLSDASRARLDMAAFSRFLRAQEGKRYDYRQVLQFVVRRIAPRLAGRLPWFGERLNREFCSELVTAALEDAGVLPRELNASAVSPADLVGFGIYRPHYYQLKGEPRDIPNFNGRNLAIARAA